jgi:alpha-D-ribose 1-methylphosphonate 5-triphosphate synthase subunit PhnG
MTGQTDSTPEKRRAALGVLARATLAELQQPIETHWPRLDARDLRSPEIGLVMVRGRTGGDGAPFNLGEVTVTRAVVELPDGRRGYGQTLGRDKAKARLAAIADALWLGDEDRARIECEVLSPVRARLVTARARTASETAATRVDFFTLVRGDPEK